MVIAVLRFLRILGLALFLGGGAAITIVVAPAAFQVLSPDRAAAGAVVGRALRVFEYLSLGVLGSALAASLILRFLKSPSALSDAGLGLLLAGTLVLRLWLTPALAEARPAGTEAGSRFDGLHRLYVRVFAVEMAVAAAALFAASRERRSPGKP